MRKGDGDPITAFSVLPATEKEKKYALAREINEIVPYLAHGLSQKLAQNRLRGKVCVRAVMGERWGVFVSADNPCKDIPNVIMYPESILNEDRTLVNAMLRHEVGKLNHSLNREMNDLKAWCVSENVDFDMIAPLVDTIHEVSVDYLEMRDSFIDDPAADFRPRYENWIDVREMSAKLGTQEPYKQALVLTFIYALWKSGLTGKAQMRSAWSEADEALKKAFSQDTRVIAMRALRSSLGQVKVNIVRDQLYPRFAPLIKKSEHAPLFEGENPNDAIYPATAQGHFQIFLEDRTPQTHEGKRDDAGGKRHISQGLKEPLDKALHHQESDADLSPDMPVLPGQNQDLENKGPNGFSQDASDCDQHGQGGLGSGRDSGGNGRGHSGAESVEDIDGGSIMSGMAWQLIPKTIRHDLEQLRYQPDRNTDRESGDSPQGGDEEQEAARLPLAYQQRGGTTNNQSVDALFHRSRNTLAAQLQDLRRLFASPLEQAFANNPSLPECDVNAKECDTWIQDVEGLEGIKERQRQQMRNKYRETSGLDGLALGLYSEYMEQMRVFTEDLVDFFTRKFQADKGYKYIANQHRGARLQRGWARKILGRKDEYVSIQPTIFRKKTLPHIPRLVWSLVIDNSGSCGGEIITAEIKTTIALIAAARQLHVPLEIAAFGSDHNYRFMKVFDQELRGDDLSKLVLLKADQGTPDVETLNAVCQSLIDYASRFNRSYNFVYFMTDGQSGSGSIKAVIEKFRREIVITGIGLGCAAKTIAAAWGGNSVAAEDIDRLSDVLIQKIQEQIWETFD
ncbi:MAG: hypothetical protein LBS45_09330 [Synergistaceae bacterium]|jgi:hypothetical protein|nr:hypothetical protein [Synergistaceae bacterium]